MPMLAMSPTAAYLHCPQQCSALPCPYKNSNNILAPCQPSLQEHVLATVGRRMTACILRLTQHRREHHCRPMQCDSVAWHPRLTCSTPGWGYWAPEAQALVLPRRPIPPHQLQVICRPQERHPAPTARAASPGCSCVQQHSDGAGGVKAAAQAVPCGHPANHSDCRLARVDAHAFASSLSSRPGPRRRPTGSDSNAVNAQHGASRVLGCFKPLFGGPGAEGGGCVHRGRATGEQQSLGAHRGRHSQRGARGARWRGRRWWGSGRPDPTRRA